MQRLSESYLLTLETAAKKAAAQGSLDVTLAYQEEIKRFTSSKTVPEIDEPNLAAVVSKLRTFWRAEAGRQAKARNATRLALTTAQIKQLRATEMELTKAFNIEGAKEVRKSIESLSSSLPATPPPSEPSASAIAATPAAPASVGRPGMTAEKMDLYVDGISGMIVYVNKKEVLSDTNDFHASKARVSLREGDTIAIRNRNAGIENAVWVSCIASTGEFLFEISPTWLGYLPPNPDRWWDVKLIKEKAPLQPMDPKYPYTGRIQHAAAMTPQYRGATPFTSLLKNNIATYYLYTVTRDDLITKKVDPTTVIDGVALGKAYLGKTVRLATLADPTAGLVVANFEASLLPFAEAKPENYQFKIVPGVDPGTVAFASVAQAGFFLQQGDNRIHLVKGLSPASTFWIDKPLVGNEGVSIASYNASGHYIVVRQGQIALVSGLKDGSVSLFLLK